MLQEPAASHWAQQNFGPQATDVQHRLVDALVQSQGRAVLIQQMSGLDTKQPYGGMWPKVHQEVELQLSKVPGAQRFRPPRACYNLMVVNGRLLLPFRHADSLSVPASKARLTTKVARELSAMLAAAAPAADLFSLFSPEDLSETPVLKRPELIYLAPQTKVIYVPYVSHAHSGLLKAWWGEAMMEADGTLAWRQDPEELPVSHALLSFRRSGPINVPVSQPAATPRFNEGDLPPLGFPGDSGELAR
ncbi:hypothetical protein GA0070616_2243 [Micromonospora nigra]|uniref:Uncharacterized protein n=1 Tax=Micromonospora nigra TaxID=145857 RepID=A0A1C6RVK6_9ACTN|nr:hypothetical protein [Micromonospora nigra]SCL21233.1 hypothetical protein GA0070616_2243 [Micromonospora nigra]